MPFELYLGGTLHVYYNSLTFFADTLSLCNFL